MIASQYIKSTTDKPKQYKDYEAINVLKWNNSKWKTLCPYYLKTDGNETNKNDGNIIFENFYQGCKVYDKVYDIKVYPSKYQTNDPKYLWWEFVPIIDTGDILVDENNNINYNTYNRWKNSLWNCKHPIRYPNKFSNKTNVKFSLCIDTNGVIETRMNYLQSRKEIYVKEYVRLIKNIKEYNILLDKLKNNQNIMICEVDVPAKHKKGEYNNCDNDNICELTIDILEKMLNDTSEAFGHGLCLAYALLLDLKQ